MILLFPVILFSQEDYNFQFVSSPLGDLKSISRLEYYSHVNLLLCMQNSRDSTHLLFFSTDNGKNWEERDPNALFNQNANFLITKNKTLIAGWGTNLTEFMGNFILDAGTWFSNDLGYTWLLNTERPYPEDSLLKFVETNLDNELFIVDWDDMWYSDNFGDLWDFRGEKYHYDLIHNKVKNYTSICKKSGGLFNFNYTEGFNHWISKTSNIPDERFRVMEIDENGSLIGFTNETDSTSGIYFSEDNGYNCRLIRKLNANENINTIKTYKNAIVIGTNKGMEVTYDNGQTWQKIKLPNILEADKNIKYISIDKETGNIFAIYGNNYIVRGKIIITSVEEFSNTENIGISPNPATDYIEINNVMLREVKDPVVKIYDVLGNVVVLLGDSRFRGNDIWDSDEGEIIRIDVSSLSPGVYFVQVGNKLSKFIKVE